MRGAEVHVIGCDERVERALERAVALGEVGVQVAAYLGERLILDAWVGDVDAQHSRPVGSDTLFPVFSVTKAVTATALHLQAERGLVAYDDRVSDHWPEFGAHGKTATIRDVLMHRAGVPHLPEGMTTEQACDYDWMIDHIARLQPIGAPGERTIYHSQSFGWVLAEVVRRADPEHRPFGEFVRAEICAPLAIDDIWVGLPERHEPRVARLVPLPPATVPAVPLRQQTMPAAVVPGVVYNRRDVHAGCLPGAGGIADARSVARLFAMLANRGTLDGVRLLSADRVESFAEERPDGNVVDEVLKRPMCIGVGGYWLGGPSPPAEPVVGGHRRILCHPGAGGSIAWADLDLPLAVSICHNRMFANDFSQPPEAHPFHLLGETIREIAAERRLATADGGRADP